jgi:asparagine synthase (glutamine-hydrolysing)
MACEALRARAHLNHYVERVVDLIDPAENQLYRLTMDEARTLLLEDSPEAIGRVEGSFALVARAGKTVRMARSLDRPIRYFLAKRTEGPVSPRASMRFTPG